MFISQILNIEPYFKSHNEKEPHKFIVKQRQCSCFGRVIDSNFTREVTLEPKEGQGVLK